MRTTLLFISMLLCFTSTFAQQNVTVEYGPVQKNKYSEYFIDLNVFDADKSGLYAVQVPFAVVYSTYLGGIKNFHIAKYNSDFTKASAFSMDEVEGKDKSYLLTTSLKNQIYIFTAIETDQNKKEIYVQSVNKQDFSPKQDVKKIAEIDIAENPKKATKFRSNEGSSFAFNPDKTRERSNFEIDYSPDSSKIVVSYRILSRDARYLNHGFFVMGRNFKTLWKFENPAYEEEGVLSYYYYKIDNNGEVFMLARVFDNEESIEQAEKLKKKALLIKVRRTHREANYSFKVHTFAAGKKIKTIPIAQPDKFIAFGEIALSPKNDVIVTGLYADKGKSSIKGAFSMKINKTTKQIVDKDFIELEEQFLIEGMPEKTLKVYKENISKGLEYDDNDYRTNDMLFHPNGTYSLIVEQNYHEIKTENVGKNSWVDNNYYHSGDIWMINYKADGSLNWKQKIVKSQKAVNLDNVYSSFELHTSNNKTYFIYNEIPPNGAYKKSKACVVTIDGTGKISKQELFSSAVTKFVLMPHSFRAINPSSVVFYTQKKLDYQFVKLSF